MDSIALESQYTSGCYPKREIAVVRGEGARVWDEQGNEYIDCVAGHGVGIVGHCNPAVVAAICEQAGTLITCPEIFYNDIRAKLLEKLVAITPANLTRAYLANSGTEAIEAALKFARLSTGRTGYVATKSGFHGRTMGALSATWEPKYRKPYMPLIAGFSHVSYGDLEQMDAAITDETASVIIEPVQGEGGVNPGDAAYLQGVQALCRERGALMILDEVQTGFGRTGSLFACEQFGLEPDLLCLAKAIAGGLPMGAVVFSETVQNIKPGVHGSTFGGNPLACAAANAAIDFIIDNDLPAEALRKGQWLMDRVRGMDLRVVKEVRGMGLMIGIQLRKRAVPYLRALLAEGVLALPAGSRVVRLLPPLVITDEELATVCETLQKVLSA